MYYTEIDIILFHSFKHHYLSCFEWVMKNNNKWDNEVDLMLKSLGSSQLDMYTGGLTVNDIKKEIYSFLNKADLIAKENYAHWINNGYRELILSDGSTWTLRFLEREEYVHIHPSRYSAHTLRIKANVLKTVLCTLLFVEDWQKIDAARINEYRINMLNLSPIDVEKEHSEITKVIKLFIDKRNY